MKKLSFKSLVCLLLVAVLTVSVVYMPGMSLTASAACANGCSFTAQKIGAKYLKSESTCGKQAVYYYSCAVCGASSAETNDAKTFNYGTAPEHNWGPVQTVPATCTEPEMKVQTCSRCGQKYAKKGSGTALGHSEKVISNGDGTHTTICMKSCGLHEVEDCSTAVTVCGQIPLCDICKAPYGKTEGHDLSIAEIKKNPTCTEPGEALKKCTRCDYTVTEAIDALGHDNTILKVIKNATCEEDGMESVKCKRCDFAEEKVIPATGHAYKKTTYPVTCISDGYDLYQCLNCNHSYKDNWVTDRQHNYTETRKEATCTAAGLITYICSTCGDRKEDVVIPALGHEMEGAVITKAPSCSEEGLMTDKCKRCSRTVTETIPALGHDLTVAVIPATCTEGGFTRSTCSRCNYVSEDNNIPALGHDKKITNAIPPTCVYEGYHVYTCARCGIEDREKLPALGHDYTYTSDGNATCTQDGTKTGKCKNCPQTIKGEPDPGSALGHSFTLYISNGNATCTDNATEWAACDRGCGAKDIREIENSALGHEIEKIPGVEATCTKTGLTEGEKCKRCNVTVKAQEVVPVKEHDLIEEIITPPTCSASGTANYKCKDCSFAKTDAVPATGNHAWDDGTVTVKADCFQDGETVYKCRTCGETKTEKVNRFEHIYSAEYTVDLQPTCYREGEQSKHCIREGCTAKIDTVKLPMTDHDLGEYESNNDATCENNGTKSRKCKVCTYKTSPIEEPGTALGHKYTNYVSDGNVTCTEDGTQTAYCDNGCGIPNTIVEEATGHEEFINAGKEPTCTEEGLTEGKTCTKCGATIVAQEIIPALTHNEAIKAEKAPTCTEEGLTEGRYCIVCEEDIIPQESIPKLGHDYSKKYTKATTSKDGKIDYTCKRCDKKTTKKVSKIASIKLSQSTFYYNGEAQTPEKAVIKDADGNSLKLGTDYDFDYSSGNFSAKVGTYKIKIVFKGKYSGSKTLSFKIVPAVVTGIKAKANTTAVKLTWNKAGGATGYRVYRYDTKNKKWVKVKSSTKETSYTIKSLKAGTAYTFAVKPYYKKGDTVIWGKYTQFATATAPETPKITVTKKATTATVNWDKVSGATGYVVYYSYEKNGTYKKLDAVKNTTTFSVKNLTAGKGIFFKVRAYKKTANGNVYSGYSSAKKIVPTII